MDLVDQIRAAYPTPCMAVDAVLDALLELHEVTPSGQVTSGLESQSYCVGGAALRFLRSQPDYNGFPGQATLALLFCVRIRADSRDPCTSHYRQAETIIRFNDTGEFSEAWAALADALVTPCSQEEGA